MKSVLDLELTRRPFLCVKVGVLAVLFAASLLIAPPAEAVGPPGCKEGRFRFMGDPWAESAPFLHPNLPSPAPGISQIHVTGLLVYTDCKPIKKPKKNRKALVANYIEWCWESERITYTQGVTFWAQARDDKGKRVRFGPFFVHDNNPGPGEWRCRKDYNLFEPFKNMKFRHDPRWKAQFKVQVRLFPDTQKFNFLTAAGLKTNHIYKNKGEVMSRWKWARTPAF